MLPRCFVPPCSLWNYKFQRQSQFLGIGFWGHARGMGVERAGSERSMDGGKICYIICAAQCKIKMQASCSKWKKNVSSFLLQCLLTSRGVLKFALNVTLPQHRITHGEVQTLTGALGPTLTRLLSMYPTPTLPTTVSPLGVQGGSSHWVETGEPAPYNLPKRSKEALRKDHVWIHAPGCWHTLLLPSDTTYQIQIQR